MTTEERTEGGRALAAVIIGPNVPWDVLSEAVRERYMRAYEAATVVWERERGRAYGMQLITNRPAPMGRPETFTDYPGDPLFGAGEERGGDG